MKNNQNGRSMVEMLGVLAIIGVLSAGGLAGYSKAMFKHKLNATMDQITMLVTNIRTMYGTQSDYTGLNNGKAVKLGIVPAVMGTGTADDAALTNPFKGSVKIAPADSKSTSAGVTGFTVLYTGLPKEACIALATSDFGSGAGSGFIGVDAAATASGQNATDLASTAVIGTGASGNVGTSGTRAEGSAYTMSYAIAACSGDVSSVIWKFY